MHISRKILWKLCVGTCLLEPNVATPLTMPSPLTRCPTMQLECCSCYYFINRYIYVKCGLHVTFYSKYLKIFFSRTTGPIWTKLGTKYPWVKGIQVCSKEVPRPFPGGDNYEIAKIQWQYLKISSSRSTGPISTKLNLAQSIRWWREFKFIQMKGHNLSLRGDNYEIAKIHWSNKKVIKKSSSLEPLG